MGYILFSSEKEIAINANHTWNGIIEYSYDNRIWKEWHGETIINNNIYMRGVNNEKISNYSSWIINGKNVRCQGNIENLLDYKSVINNIHPKMGEGCFACMFRKCDALIEAPQLSAIELSKGCYCGMFEGCTSLVKVSELHAQKLSQSCYAEMFSCCTSLTNVIMFSEAKLEKGSYFQMFRDCTSLKELSPLLITEVPSFAVSEMFKGCLEAKINLSFVDLLTAKKAIIEQNMMRDNPMFQTVNINNKEYDVNVLKLA